MCCAAAGVYGNSTNATGLGMMGQGATGVYGKSAAGGGGAGVTGEANASNDKGVYGTAASAGGYGVFAGNPTGMALGVAGNATQNRDKGGIVKAMVYLQGDPVRNLRCLNSQMPTGGSSTDKCGINVTLVGVGGDLSYYVDFPFKVSDRFVSAKPQRSGAINAGANFAFDGENTIAVGLFNPGDASDNTRASLMLIVY